MVKITAGLLLTLLGVCFGLYLYIFTNAKDIVLTSVSIGCIVSGLVLLVWFYLTRAKPASEAAVAVIDATRSKSSILDRNNQLLSEWSQTNQTRDKLKVLEMSAKLEEGK